MAVWVSRYSNKELQNGNYYPVGISIGKPKWPLGYEVREQCFSLAPKGYMLNFDIDRFREAYYGKLNEIGEEKVISMVNRLDEKAIEEGKELVLLCFEDIRKEGEWCHRTMFAEWWAEHTGELIDELPDPSAPKKEKKAKVEEPKQEEDSGWQMTLFDL